MTYASVADIQAALQDGTFETPTYAETPAGLEAARHDLKTVEDLFVALGGHAFVSEAERARRDLVLRAFREKVADLSKKLRDARVNAIAYSDPWGFEASKEALDALQEGMSKAIAKVPSAVPLNAVFGKHGHAFLRDAAPIERANRARLESELSSARLRHRELVDAVNVLLAQRAPDEALRAAMERAFEAGMAMKMMENALAKVPPSSPKEWNRAIAERLEQYKSAGFVGPLFDAPRGGTMDRATLESGQDGFFFDLGSAAVVSMPIRSAVGRSISLHTPGLKRARVVGPTRGGVLYVLATGQIRPFTIPPLGQRQAFALGEMPAGAEAVVFSGVPGFTAEEAASVFAGMTGEEYRFRFRGREELVSERLGTPALEGKACPHPSIIFDAGVGPRGRYVCTGQGCSLTLEADAFRSIIDLENAVIREELKKQRALADGNRQTAEDMRQRNCVLSDQLGDLECENNELLRDNARLRRDYEKATRKAGK